MNKGKKIVLAALTAVLISVPCGAYAASRTLTSSITLDGKTCEITINSASEKSINARTTTGATGYYAAVTLTGYELLDTDPTKKKQKIQSDKKEYSVNVTFGSDSGYVFYQAISNHTVSHGTKSLSKGLSLEGLDE